MKRRNVILSWIIALPILTPVVYCWYSTWATNRAMVRFVKQAQSLQIAEATAADVSKLVNSYRGLATRADFMVAPSGRGVGVVDFENTWLHRLHLAPPMVFTCKLWIEDNNLGNRWLQMVYAGNSREEVGTFVSEGRSTLTSSDEVLHAPQEGYFRISGGRPEGFLGVMITPNVPTDLRHLAYNFDLTCLEKFGGCKTYNEMLPVLARKDLYWGQDAWLHEHRPNH
jgi:hypothetical protein